MDDEHDHQSEFIGNKFRNKNTFTKRLMLSAKVKKLYPNRIPIIIEPYKPTDPIISKNKFLVPMCVTISKLTSLIKNHISNMNSGTSLFLYVINTSITIHRQQSNTIWNKLTGYNHNNLQCHVPESFNMILAPASVTVETIYQQYSDNDGFLYILYTLENTFG